MAKVQKRKSHKNITKSKGFKLAIGLTAAVAAIGATCGLAIGLCSASKTKYVDIDPLNENGSNRTYFASDTTKDQTTWNASDEEPKVSSTLMNDLGKCTIDSINTSPEDRFKYTEMIGNGPDTSILDKSFQQSGYYAQTYWVHQADTSLKDGGTKWNYQEPKLNYNNFPQDDLELTNGTSVTLGKMSSAAQKPSGASNTDFVNTYRAAYDTYADHARKALVLPGYQHITPLTILKGNQKRIYDSMGYVLIDSEVPDLNIASVQFKAEQSAFLTGVSACQYLEENWEDVYSKVNNGQLAMGCFGGQNIITVTCFMGGLELGIWFYNNYILPKTEFWSKASDEEKEKRTVKFISLGKESSYFSGTFVIGDAKLIVQELLARGACCIMAVAGPQTGDVVSEVVAQRSPCRVLGVDSAMENGDWGQYYSKSNLFKEKTKVVLCSAEKNVAQLSAQILNNMWCKNRVVYPDLNADGSKSEYYALDDDKTINNIVTHYTGGTEEERNLLTENAKKGAVGTIGYTSIGSLYNNGVNLSEAGQDHLLTALKLLGGSWANIETYNDAVTAILDLDLPETTILDGRKVEPMNLIDFINKNRYFQY